MDKSVVPEEVVCEMARAGKAIDADYGCGKWQPKGKNSPVWNHGDGPGMWYSQAHRRSL